VDDTTCRIDEFGPLPVVRPASVAELGDLVRRAASTSQAVYPLGGRTRLDLGLPPAQPGVAIDLTALSQVIDYPARDMTITVQAGVRVAELQRLLAAEGQRLPIDVPSPDRATLGGALATNASGPRRLGWGTLRDYVIGITTVNDEGHETKAGGRVVKNVAGYDLCKLHIGALGTLGVISQVTLKVRPLPEAQALLTFGCDGAALGGLLDELHASRMRPACLDVVNAAAARWLAARAGLALPGQAWVVIVGYEDSEAAVNWQLQQAIRELTQAGVHGVEATAGAATEPLWRALAELTAPEESALTVRAGVLPARVAELVHLAAKLPGQPLIQAHAGSGVVRVHFAAGLTPDQARAAVEKLAGACHHVTLPRCPAAWKRELPIWGRPRGDLALMRQVKQALDPRRLFNPGRFLGGI
jgi:glycolate oxidase FAD binding subunit